ncbi:polysaccharide pyruvyl transferase family protein [Lactonifactor sp. BIOML-A3]|uniref:polysaccharide pyruvyl transferase family protein n=1 Tax=unclassified Lactonifactor TaxID=2636670 RepID=UPI0012AF1588|nr:MULTISPECIES: polysaccharide pyruvyl transferase family protein [unclassified Lactonifactor]MSA01739.1 polysaccharide pyruvyl transferase family protein [Lactonifactor sp. BIOML-A5]MSA08737.1 polysaccharide pyruvyl transferase family protein [Lactonifactor sp. BIOML-A4]MSA13867.1 polysaccharide pyruvyl transferase family protein [Lactonifactor sp. BIOML-A3]MSA17108.1 polysaccharide pyruvyl transferase family protein [Lactonifactor sp. BIOML-A2]MSA37787.1 polysaccharide pyruvyl transferase f
MNKIGICTLFTGYNFGSALQCYASKRIIEKTGYEPVVYKLKGSLIEGRDVRVKKIVVLLLRSITHFKEANRVRKSYQSSFNKTMSETSMNLFLEFYKNEIAPNYVSYLQLKNIAKKNQYTAFICGSDQIWDPTDLYLDPFYYLEFAPYSKRIAFAPSLGKELIPDYNKKQFTKKLMGIRFLSSRENSGKMLIEKITNRLCEELIDPTLVLNKHEWIELLKLKKENTDRYILAYFLDAPSELAKTRVNSYARKHDIPVYYIPYLNIEEENWISQDCGPIQFLNLVLNAEVIFTDSFHGLAFSLNFEKDIYAFSRNYGASQNQSTRLLSILNSMDLLCRYDSENEQEPINYKMITQKLNELRENCYYYLNSCITEVEKNNDK